MEFLTGWGAQSFWWFAFPHFIVTSPFPVSETFFLWCGGNNLYLCGISLLLIQWNMCCWLCETDPVLQRWSHVKITNLFHFFKNLSCRELYSIVNECWKCHIRHDSTNTTLISENMKIIRKNKLFRRPSLRLHSSFIRLNNWIKNKWTLLSNFHIVQIKWFEKKKASGHQDILCFP